MPSEEHLASLPPHAIEVNDPFWSRYQAELVDKGLPAQYRQLVETNRIKNFERAAKGERDGFEGYRFNDSDVYKWLEACAYALSTTAGKSGATSKELRRMVDETVDIVARAQMADGYLNTYFQLMHPDMRWRNLNAMHEMYCAGHLIEAAVALQECLQDSRLLKVAQKFADHIESTFGPGKRHGYCGHQEIELALIRLANTTQERKYRDLAKWMVEERGKRPSPFEQELEDKDAIALSPAAAALMLKDGRYTGEYLQDHLPIREHQEVVGHAVRAMYFYIAAADLAADDEMKASLERTWANLTKKRMYVTGGIGPSGDNEGFTTDYDLPNLTAYAETCAAVGLVFWGHSLLQMTGNSEYADVMERALFNGALAGISLDTTHYFYDNPLESRGQHKRTPWFGCACCPPNIARLIGNVGKYAVSSTKEAFWIHLPIGLQATTTLSGVRAQISVRSNYPWSGDIEITVDPEKPVVAELRFRIPDWADDVETEIPGLEDAAEYESGYVVVKKRWQKGDRATFRIEMNPKWVAADPRVRDNLGRVALTRGPLVFCAEEHDLGFAPQLFSADTEAELEAVGSRLPVSVGDMQEIEIQTIAVPGLRESEDFPDQLYAELDSIANEEATAKFIPYFAWNNRGPNSMQVWVRTQS